MITLSPYNGRANHPTWLVALCIRTDPVLYQKARGILKVTPLEEQPAAMKELVTTAIAFWHTGADAQNISADLPADLATWTLSFVDWSDVLAAVLE